MLTLLLLALGVLGSVSSSLEEAFDTPDYYESHHTKVFGQWKNHFGKKYESILDEAYRFTVFVENWRYISKVNEKGLSYALGLNQFADLTGDEFRRYVHGKDGSCAHPNAKRNTTSKVIKKRVDAPPSVDWSTKGVVTPVKNQGQCGSCWAFSATGSMESATAIATGRLVSLSEQQLVDCSRNYGNYGCNGGWMDKAFQYVMNEGGLCSEQEYPYEAQDGVCRASTCGTKFDPIRSYQDVAHDSEAALVNALVSKPVSILIEADQSAFQFYHSGVLTGNCGTRLDHGVLAVGYGNENGQDYWKVKNSWGGSWGEQGYVKICRNCNANGGQGECGILLGPSYPIV